MQSVLVTGANKGIGLAIARAVLEHGPDTFVFLGSRDAGRGDEAARSLTATDPTWESRVLPVSLDVASGSSVREALEVVRARLGEGHLHGVVNNAGINVGAGNTLAHMLDVNVVGLHRVSEAFASVLDPRAGRIVNVTSAAGPSFVATCSDERRRFFVDPAMTWPKLRAFMDECIALGDRPASFAARGLGDGAPYGLSKACANACTLALANAYPSLRINACTPGFIETDMTRGFIEPGKSGRDVGMKTPAEGAKAPLLLLFGELEGNARYYGSDGKRSPLDRYRAPGSPPYDGT